MPIERVNVRIMEKVNWRSEFTRSKVGTVSPYRTDGPKLEGRNKERQIALP
jgi:hypothetical protein